MDKRYRQANKEARLSLYLTLLYLIFWIAFAYLLGDQAGLLGFPAWFELSCLFAPIGFIIACYFIVKYQFKDIPLESPQSIPPHE
ncbi:DUF997 family protein [Orbus sasakiae]|uniref:DUF997 family protein n=2 Tax=Orbus sasakiae TaxID=1078475 RepID=A0ABP9N522_9GAMM